MDAEVIVFKVASNEKKSCRRLWMINSEIVSENPYTLNQAVRSSSGKKRGGKGGAGAGGGG